MTNNLRLTTNRCFTFIEVVIAAAIFLIFAIGAYQGYAAVYTSIASSRHKALAADLSNAQFEIIKNLPYASVGTVGGTPPGLVTSVVTMVRDGISFTVTTNIINVDDPYDGIGGGADAFPADYKLVEIKIECLTCKNLAPAEVTGRVAPKNLET